MRTFLFGVMFLCASCGASADEVAELRAQGEEQQAQIAALQAQLQSESGGSETVQTLGNLARCLKDTNLGNLRARAQASAIAEHLQRCGAFGVGELEGSGTRPEASAERVAECYSACAWFRGSRGTDERRRLLGRSTWRFDRTGQVAYCCFSGRRHLGCESWRGARRVTQSMCGSQLREDPENICGACRDEAPNVQQNLGIDPPPGMEEESSEENGEETAEEATEEAAAE